VAVEYTLLADRGGGDRRECSLDPTEIVDVGTARRPFRGDDDLSGALWHDRVKLAAGVEAARGLTVFCYCRITWIGTPAVLRRIPSLAVNSTNTWRSCYNRDKRVISRTLARAFCEELYQFVGFKGQEKRINTVRFDKSDR